MQAESRFIFESMKYKIVMAVGAFAVSLAVVWCVFKIVTSCNLFQFVSVILSLFALSLAMYAFYRHRKLVDRYANFVNTTSENNKTIFDEENNIDRYVVVEFDGKFGVHKYDKHNILCFIVRTFQYERYNDASRKKARLRAYSLLNHITDNGKLWKQERTEK